MVNAGASAAGFVDLLAGVIAVEIYSSLDPQSVAAAPPLDYSAVELLVPLGAAAALFTAAAAIYRRHMGRAAVPAPAAANRRPLSEVVVFISCVAAGVLDFFFFVRPAGGAEDHGAQQAARALGMAAHRALPTAATVTFFYGMMLIVIGHVRAGGEGGGRAIAGASDGEIQEGPVRLLTNIAVGAVAVLFFLITMAFCVQY